MNRVTHFEIPSDDPETSMAFYAGVFGWKFQKFGSFPYWTADTGPEGLPGINGAVMKKRHPQQPVTNSIDVANLEQTINAIEQAGGVIVVPKMAIPGVGWLAYFKDPDQNIFGIMQPDPSAK